MNENNTKIKECYTCHEFKPLTEFYSDSKKRPYAYCKKCSNLRRVEHERKKIRKCHNCGEEKQSRNFLISSHSYCNECHNNQKKLKEKSLRLCFICKEIKSIDQFYFRGYMSDYENICSFCDRKKVKRQINRARNSNNWQRRLRGIMLSGAKVRARKKGIFFDLVLSDLEVPEICPVLKIKLNPLNKKREDDSPSLDRIDNNKNIGYIKSNIKIISARANNIKNVGNEIEHRLIADYIRANTIEDYSI